MSSTYLIQAVFEPAQLPQETICPSVAFAKGQIGNSSGQSIIYYNIKLSLSYPINCFNPTKNVHKQVNVNLVIF